MRNRILLLLCLFSFVSTDLFAQSLSKDNFSLYLFGTEYQLLGDYSSAMELYDVSIFRSDSSVYVPSLLSSLNLRLMSGDFGANTEKLLRLAGTSGVDESLLTDMMIHFKMGKHHFADAKSLCFKILSVNPNDKKILSFVPLIDYYMDNKDSSLVRINDFESRYGIDSRLYSVKRQILSDFTLYDSLLFYNRRVSELYPENLSILADLANVEAALGNDSVAYNLWKLVESQDSTSIEFIASSNFFYSTRGFKRDAILSSSKLLCSDIIKPEAKEQIISQLFIAIDPDNDSTYNSLLDSIFKKCSECEKDTSSTVRNLSLSYFYFRKDFDYCDTILMSLQNSFPLSPKYPIQRAQLFSQQNCFDKAFSIIDSSILLNPHVSDYVIFKAEMIKETVSQKECYNFIKKIIKSECQDSSLSHYYCYLADMEYKEGSHKLAFKHYENALSHNPEDIITLNNYAYFLAQSDQSLDKALGMSHKCNLLVKSNPTYLDTEAFILYKLKRYKEAKELMDTVFSLSESEFSDEILLHYADILAALGNDILAKDYYNRALKAGADESLIKDRINSLK